MRVQLPSFPPSFRSHGIAFLKSKYQILQKVWAAATGILPQMEYLLTLHRITSEALQLKLASSSGYAARQYLIKRGIDADLMREFGLGLAPNRPAALIGWLKGQGYTSEQIVEAGIARSDGQDRFRDRLMFPIHDEDGHCIAFSGRVLRDTQQPKYLNSPETPIFAKREVLYSLHRALPHIAAGGCAILVEGQMDVIGLWKAGFKNAVATCGTSLTESHADSLGRHCSQCYINHDADEAGMKATHRAIFSLLNAGVEPRIVRLHGAKDPDEFIALYGADAYRDRLEKSQSYLEWAVEVARYLHDNLTPEGRLQTVKWIVPLLAVARANGAHDGVAKALGVRRSFVDSCVQEASRGVVSYLMSDAVDAVSLARRVSQ